MSSLLPLAMMTGMPLLATRRAMWHLVSIPPRPSDDFDVCMYCSMSLLSATCMWRITWLSGDEGLPLYMPSMLLRMMSVSTRIISAMRPESSSLSVNMSSVMERVSFSLTIGMTPSLSITSMQFFWFW